MYEYDLFYNSYGKKNSFSLGTKFVYKRGSTRMPDSITGKKFSIFNFIILKERPHGGSTKSKILA
jgi:hypothetical protein